MYQESGLEISKLIFQYLIITDPIEMEKYTQKLDEMVRRKYLTYSLFN